MTEKNLRAVKALFGAMERTLFICRHNIRLDCGDIEYERFWAEYYAKYIEQTLPRVFSDDYAEKTAGEVTEMLRRGTKAVYDVNIYALLYADLQALPPSELFAGVMKLNSRRHELEEKFSVPVRDGLRDQLERLISEAYTDSLKLEAAIASHWEPATMASFMEQLSGGEFGGTRYSRELWRRSYRPKIVDLIEAAG